VQQVCPDGKLNRTQFVDLYKRMFPGGKSAAFYQHLFRVYDADHSGKLEFPEFIQVSYYMSVAVILMYKINMQFIDLSTDIVSMPSV